MGFKTVCDGLSPFYVDILDPRIDLL